jgi:citrate lyase subunit beta/citryl-CoA lyase
MGNQAERPAALRRSWVFIGAADERVFTRAWSSAADAVIADLEDSTAPHLRPKARGLLRQYVDGCRAAGKVPCVRINPLEGDGFQDLDAALAARASVIFLPKSERPEQIVALAARIEAAGAGNTEIVPNVETAAGLVRTLAIASAHPRVSACLVASEDMTTSLGAERGRDGVELQYARARFLVECRAAGVIPIDCPYTFSDAEGAEAETRVARRLGYPAKSAVDVTHAAVINRVLTPGDDEVQRAQRIVSLFDEAHAAGRRAEVDGNILEVPIYLNAKRLIERHRLLTGA